MAIFWDSDITVRGDLMDLTKYVLNADGQPEPEADLLKWAMWMGTGDNKVIAREQVTPTTRVSTVFLGMDHRCGDGDPLLWETMVFGGKLDSLCERYASKADALAGHVQMVERVKAS